MPSTNKTPNYGLPQYVADDKPTYLGDFNKAMLDIDTAMKNNADSVSGVTTSVDTAVSTSSEALKNSSEALDSVTSAVDTANSAKTIAQNAQTTASNAQATASSAENSANTALTNSQTALTSAETAVTNSEEAQSTSQNALTQSATNSSKITALQSWVNSNIGTNNASLYLSSNPNLKLLGLAGLIESRQGTISGNTTIIGTLPKNLRPKSTRIIYGGCLLFWSDTNSTLFRNLTINTNGQIIVPSNNFTNANIQCMLCTNNWDT